MRHHFSNVCVTTLGGQPQIVTLALDALQASGEVINDLIVVHLALDNPRYQASHQRLAETLASSPYCGQIRYLPHLVRLRGQPLADLDSELALDAASDTFEQLFRQLKQHDCTIHLCSTLR